MNRYLTFSLAISITLSLPSVPTRAANKPRARQTEGAPAVWTNEDLERLRGLGLISVVGQGPGPDTVEAPTPTPYVRTQDPEWYAEQADNLRAELASRQAELQHYRQTIDDARSLETMTGGINLDEGDIGITPEAGIEILQRRVNETEAELDALEDLARHNGIPPGVLRG
jgi:hypothetical protein